MIYKSLLNHRLTKDEIKNIVLLIKGEPNDVYKEKLYQMTFDDDNRISTNALWVFTHLASVDNQWLCSKRDNFINRSLLEHDTSKLRLILCILLRQPFYEEDVGTDFIDYCLMRLTDQKSPYAIRAQCIKLAYKQMRYWPDLLSELRQTLEMMSCAPLSPGLQSARQQIMNKLR